MRTRNTGRAMIAGLVMTMALAACGADPGAGDDGVASLGEDGMTPSSVAEDAEAPRDPDEAFALFEACMEDNGVELPKRQDEDGGLEVRRQAGESGETNMMVNGVEVDPEVFEAAREICQPHLANLDRGFDLTPEQEAAMEDANLAFQECMADHGIEGEFGMAVAGGEAALGTFESADEADPQAAPAAGEGEMVEDEELQAATEECMQVFEDVPELEGLFRGRDQ